MLSITFYCYIRQISVEFVQKKHSVIYHETSFTDSSAESFSFPYFDLILPSPGRSGFLTAPDLHKKNVRNPNNLLKLNDSGFIRFLFYILVNLWYDLHQS